MKAIHVLNHTDMNALRLVSLCALLMGKGSRLEIPQRPSQCRLLMKLVQKLPFQLSFILICFLIITVHIETIHICSVQE